MSAHDLVSLFNWVELRPPEQALAHKTVYKACILAAIIYPNAALSAMPYNSGWHSSLARKVQSVLEGQSWPPSTQDLQLWILMVGGIAAADV